jgi:uncharacterized Zn finger protein (UPF0148 family)
MFCTKCGFQIKDGYKFCPKCGTPAYVEQEEQKGNVKQEVVDVVTKVTNNTSSKKHVSTIVETKANKAFPNPLIAEELDIEGIMKSAELGDKKAMQRQAFRYEMGIGVEKDIKKAEELYNKAGGKECIITSSASMYVLGVELKDYLCKTSK